MLELKIFFFRPVLPAFQRRDPLPVMVGFNSFNPLQFFLFCFILQYWQDCIERFYHRKKLAFIANPEASKRDAALEAEVEVAETLRPLNFVKSTLVN